MCNTLGVFLSNDPNSDHNKEGKFLQRAQTIQLICTNVSCADTLLRHGGEYQHGVSGNLMRINKESNQ